MQHFLCQIGNLRRNGSREQQGLALFRQELDDALDIREKAHIEHAVGLVEHEKLCLVQLYDLLTHQIPQTARRGNENIHTAFDRLDLRHLRYAAEDDRRTARHVARVLAHVFVNLQRKLARRREDERTDGALLPSLFARRWMIGTANAQVLPVPVWAQPIRSRPSSTGGIACC